jgi:peptidoglycan/xylan/chitin deacetylase (PgdA/CDA1 family)
LRILTFHDISDDAGDIYAVTKRLFADFLLLLKDEDYTSIRASDLLGDWPSALSRNRSVLLTFDDGYAAQREIAAELLIQRGLTATFFAITSCVGQNKLRRHFGGKERTFLSGEDLRQMELAGFEIGSHSHTHALCGALPESEVLQELSISRQILEEELGHPIASFAYPYGRRGAFSHLTRAALQGSGYQAAFTMEGTRIERDCDLLRLPRTSVDRFDTLASLRRKLDGHYDLVEKALHREKYV